MLGFSKYIQYLEEKLIIFRGKRSKSGRIIFLAGGAACLSKDTEILMYDGNKKLIQNIEIGDEVMGPDSNKRIVNNTTHGIEQMIKVTTIKGQEYICNRSHIHSFVCSFSKCGFKQGQIYNMTYDEWLNIPKSAKKTLKLYKESISFKEQKVDIDPYILGLWLGDGVRANTNIIIDNKNTQIVDFVSSKLVKYNLQFNKIKSDKVNCSVYSISRGIYEVKPNIYRNYFRENCVINSDKRIPNKYLINSEDIRKRVFAGLIDSDGYHDKNGTIEIVTKFDGLKDDIYFLASSLGYNVTIKKKITNWKGEDREYHRLFISGDMNDIPVLLGYKRPKERKQIKNVLRYGFKFQELEMDEYFGFQVEGVDNLFVLGNFLVTHNSGKGFAMKNFLDVSAGTDKIRDVDEWKSAFIRLDAVKKQFPEIRGLDLSQPKDVGELHDFITKKKIKSKTLDFLLNDLQNRTLPNIVFDITLKDRKDAEKVIPKLLEVGYDPKDIHLVWVLANFALAVKNNRDPKRGRVVPDDILLATQAGATKTMFDIIKGNQIKGMDGEIHVILNNRENTVFLKDKDGKDIETIPDRGPLKGVPQFVVTGFKSLQIKESGKSIVKEKDIQLELFKWIEDNAPKTLDLKNVFSDIKKARESEEKTK